MARIRAILNQGYSIHEDGWTETLAGVKMLLTLITIMEEKGDSFNAALLLRHVIISSSYLAEQIFNKSVQQYIRQSNGSISQEDINNYSLRKVGISYAMKNWPEQLTGRSFDFGSGCLQSLKEITNKRNDIVHKLNDNTIFNNPRKIASEVIYTTIEACKTIEKHFYPESEFSYNEWLKAYPITKADLYKKI